MDFTFGIVTSSDKYLMQIINSIEKQNIPNYEIILIGNSKINYTKNIIKIDFDESQHPMWLTKKKNIIAQNAKYDNIVYMHDYIILDDEWYKGFCIYKKNNDYDILVNPVINLDNTRFRDWILNGLFSHGYKLIQNETIDIKNKDNWFKINDGIFNLISHRILMLDNSGTLFLDYEDEANDLQAYIYISGSYFIVKKHIMLEFPLDENHLWGQSEDIEWCQRVREKYKFKCNKYSLVKLLKQK